MTLTVLVIAALACWQAVEIWHHSSIMASWRSYAELFEGKFGQLLRCPYCLSVWVGFAFAGILLYQVPDQLIPDTRSFVVVWVVVPLCVLVGRGIGKLCPILARYLGIPRAEPFLAFILLVASVMTILAALKPLNVEDIPAFRTAGVSLLFAAKLFVYGLAISRLANLCNDFFHDKCRTPKENKGDSWLGESSIHE